MSNSFENMTVVVTGATKGIGKSVALDFAIAGAKVFALGRSIPENNDNVNIEYIACDVSNVESIENAVKSILGKCEQVDILINNAGITKDNLAMRMSLSDWDDVMDTNLRSAFLFSKAFMRGMMSKRKGRIINIGSIVGTTGNAGQANYSASKAGLIGLTKSLAKELASRNILVNLIAPGYVKTSMTDKLTEDQVKSFSDNIPLKRGAEPKEISKVVLFLASEDASYITGQVLHVDGGLAI